MTELEEVAQAIHEKRVDKCNQRLCCNPAHLQMVTHLKNQRLRVARAKTTTTL